MRSLIRLVVLASLGTFVTFASARADDGLYIAGGVGGAPRLSGELSRDYEGGDASSRFTLGKRFGRLSLELSVYGAQLHPEGAAGILGERLATVSIGGDLKYHLNLTANLELYLRGGLHKTYVGRPDEPEFTIPGGEGSGYNYGTGLQYAFRLLHLVQAAVWIDLNKQIIEFDNDELSGRLALGMLTVGVSVGTGI